MTVYRIRYKRNDSVQYVSHLDTIQVFARAGRRAGLPMVYSQGFNPKPQMVFGAPAAMGLTSDCELMDMELDCDMPCDRLVQILNDNLPLGFRILQCSIKDTKENIMALAAASCYKVKVRNKGDFSQLENTVAAIMKSDECVIPKKTKSGIKDTNIRKMIYELSLEQNGGDLILNMLLLSSNEGSLKPELLIEAINKNPGLEADILSIHRTGMFIQGKDGLIDPFTHETRWKQS